MQVENEKCPLNVCDGTGIITFEDNTYVECQCRKAMHLQNYIEKALIPIAYQNKTFDDFDPEHSGQKEIFNQLKEYVIGWEEAQIKGVGISMISKNTRVGKAQPLHSQILTPCGWKTMGEMRVGDIILHPSGVNQKVKAILPQGKIPVYKVTFTDDSYTECSAEHLWVVQSRGRKYKIGGFKVMSLKKIKEKLNLKDSSCWGYIPLVNPLNLGIQRLEQMNISVDPYLLGVFLGDGGLSVKKNIRLTTADDFIIEKVRSKIPDDVYARPLKCYGYNIVKKSWLGGRDKRHLLLDQFTRLNLMGKKSVDKFIPKEYLWSSFDVRLQVFQGLIDTDGYVSARGNIQFYTSSIQLAKGMIFLVQSFGGVARLKNKITFCNGKKFKSYAVSISLPNNFQNPCTLPKKLARYKPERKFSATRGIKSIEHVGDKECQCINVSNPDGLYITDNFIVTHNSHLACSVAHALIEKYQKSIEEDLVLFVNVTNWVDRWRAFYSRFNAETETELINYDEKQREIDALCGLDSRMNHCGLLILDDIGEVPSTDFVSSKLYSVVEYRTANNKPILITSNHNWKEMQKKYGDDGVRITDRLEEVSLGHIYYFDKPLKVKKLKTKKQAETTK